MYNHSIEGGKQYCVCMCIIFLLFGIHVSFESASTIATFRYYHIVYVRDIFIFVCLFFFLFRRFFHALCHVMAVVAVDLYCATLLMCDTKRMNSVNNKMIKEQNVPFFLLLVFFCFILWLVSSNFFSIFLRLNHFCILVASAVILLYKKVIFFIRSAIYLVINT